jgi:hypothetical protein
VDAIRIVEADLRVSDLRFARENADAAHAAIEFAGLTNEPGG